MSVTDQNGWGEVERRARHHENVIECMRNMLQVTTEDRLRGAIVSAIGELEIGHQTAAYQTLTDALKNGGVK